MLHSLPINKLTTCGILYCFNLFALCESRLTIIVVIIVIVSVSLRTDSSHCLLLRSGVGCHLIELLQNLIRVRRAVILHIIHWVAAVY